MRVRGHQHGRRRAGHRQAAGRSARAEARVAGSAALSRGLGVHRRGGSSGRAAGRGSAAASTPPRAGRRDQRSASAPTITTPPARRRTGSSQARRLKPWSMGAASTSWLPYFVDEVLDDLVARLARRHELRDLGAHLGGRSRTCTRRRACGRRCRTCRRSASASPSRAACATRHTVCAGLDVLRVQRPPPSGQRQQQTASSVAAPSGTRAVANANARSGSSAMNVPMIITPMPNQIQFTSGLILI